jgi:uncharacterized Tic20 family protein
MDKYTVFNMIKNYNNAVKDDDKNKLNPWIGVLFLLVLHVILFIVALVLLIINKSRLENYIFIILLMSLFFLSLPFPIIGSIFIIILVFTLRKKS